MIFWILYKSSILAGSFWHHAREEWGTYLLSAWWGQNSRLPVWPFGISEGSDTLVLCSFYGSWVSCLPLCLTLPWLGRWGWLVRSCILHYNRGGLIIAGCWWKCHLHILPPLILKGKEKGNFIQLVGRNPEPPCGLHWYYKGALILPGRKEKSQLPTQSSLTPPTLQLGWSGTLGSPFPRYCWQE